MYSKKSNPNYEEPHKPQIFYIISVENKHTKKLLSIQTFLFTIKNSRKTKRKTTLSTRHNILLCSRKKQSKLWRGPSSQFTTNVLLKVVPKGDKWRKSGLRGAPYSTQGHRQEFKTVGANFNLFSCECTFLWFDKLLIWKYGYKCTSLQNPWVQIPM